MLIDIIRNMDVISEKCHIASCLLLKVFDLFWHPEVKYGPFI